MPERFVYRFAWDVAKASANRRKHAVSFELAAVVFRDPLAFEDLSPQEARVRIISAREATAHERQQYESG